VRFAGWDRSMFVDHEKLRDRFGGAFRNVIAAELS